MTTIRKTSKLILVIGVTIIYQKRLVNKKKAKWIRGNFEKNMTV